MLSTKNKMKKIRKVKTPSLDIQYKYWRMSRNRQKGNESRQSDKT
jgi:hypothetical protein